MELRSCINLHYIKTPKRGVVRKILNVARGKPVLRFRNMNDIFEELDAENGHSGPMMPPKDEFRGLHTDSFRVKSEPEDVGFDCNGGGSVDSDCSESVILMQIKQTCKSKKRKRSKSAGLSQQLEKSSPVKQECSIPEATDDHDLLQPLSKLKSKRAKKAKATTKRMRMKKGSPTISQLAIITVKSEPISSEEELLQFNQVPSAFESDPEVASEPGFPDMYYCGAVPTEFPETATEFSDSPTDEYGSCIVYEPFCEDTEYDPIPLQIVSNSCWGMVEVDDTEITNYQHLDFWPSLESKIHGYITNSVDPDFTEAMSSDGNISSEDAMLCQINSEKNDDDLVKGPDARISEVYREDDLPLNLEANENLIDDCQLSSDSSLVSVADQVSTEKEEEVQCQLPTCSDSEINLSPGVISCEASDDNITVAGSGEHLKEQHPQRLFPKRKVISPTSQEKLCKAMNSIELQDGLSACKAKLYFGKQVAHTNLGPEEQPNQIRRPKSCFTPQTIGKCIKEKISSHHRVAPKASNGLSTPSPRFTTGCTSMRSCTDTAIAFSQRQMHDIECIATKLINELQIMKEIAEERLAPGPYTNTLLKYDDDEVKTTIQHVSRVEASAKKLLSMMSRDCNRFCTIMRMADKNSSIAQGDVRSRLTKTTIANKNRKITFADEAGEQLSHVKVFKRESLVADPSPNM